MLIGQIVRESGCSRDTIRYYERRGLLAPAHRRDNRYKEYPEETLARLRFICTMKEGGFTLRAIRDMLAHRDAGAATCGTISPVIASQLMRIEESIRVLRRMKRSLKAKFSACKGNPATAQCIVFEQRLGKTTKQF